MKKWLLLPLLLLLTACGANHANAPSEDTISFFYVRQTMAYGQVDGVIVPELREVADQTDHRALLEAYLAGPEDPNLLLLISPEVTVRSVETADGMVTVTFSRNLSQLSGQHLTMAAGAVAQTLLQFETVHTVRIQADNAYLNGQAYLEFQADTLLLTDDSGKRQQQTLRLYFADADQRYLMETTRSVRDMEPEELPIYLMEQLILGPTDTNLQPVIPTGTQLRGVDVEEDLCTVDLSTEFLTNRPGNALAERMTVYSIVNALTGLEQIQQVSILVEGKPVERYLYLDLSQPLVRDESLFGPVRAGLGEFDGTLCLPMEGQTGLFRCPQVIQSDGTQERGRVLLETLFDRESCNGYENPFPDGLSVLAFARSGGVCVIDLSADPLSQCESPEEEALCLQSIALTLQQSGSGRLLQINVNGIAIQDLHDLDTSSLVPNANWLNQ